MSRSITLPDGRKLAYDLRGPDNSPVILLANSLLTSYSLWDQFAEDASLRDFRILRYDQSGHGASTAPDDPSQTTFVTLSQDTAELLKALGIQKLHAWVGISMGAAMGVYFATQNPGVVEKLVLADTITSSPINAGVPDVFTPRAEIARNDNDGVAKLTEATLQRWFSEPWRESNPTEVQRMRNLMQTTSRNGFIACCNALSHKSFDLQPLLKSVGSSAQEVLLLVGERDANLPETMEKMRKEISDGFKGQQEASLVVIKGAGHVPVIDGFEQFRNEISRFLNTTPLNKM